MNSPRHLTVTETALGIGDIFRGPWLLLREVTLRTTNGKLFADAEIIPGTLPFNDWHAPGFPGVMMIEIAQQLACLIAIKSLGLTAAKIPKMRDCQMNMLKGARPVGKEDVLLCTTEFVNKKKFFYFFKANLRLADGTPIMEVSFTGVAHSA